MYYLLFAFWLVPLGLDSITYKPRLGSRFRRFLFLLWLWSWKATRTRVLPAVTVCLGAWLERELHFSEVLSLFTVWFTLDCSFVVKLCRYLHLNFSFSSVLLLSCFRGSEFYSGISVPLGFGSLGSECAIWLYLYSGITNNCLGLYSLCNLVLKLWHLFWREKWWKCQSKFCLNLSSCWNWSKIVGCFYSFGIFTMWVLFSQNFYFYFRLNKCRA
jgi:hypothetical protein